MPPFGGHNWLEQLAVILRNFISVHRYLALAEKHGYTLISGGLDEQSGRLRLDWIAVFAVYIIYVRRY